MTAAQRHEPPAPSPRDAAFLVIPGQAIEWGFHASRVRSIVIAAEWRGPAPLDLMGLVGETRDLTDHAGRVLLLESAGGLFPIRCGSRLLVRHVGPDEVQPLPLAFQATPRKDGLVSSHIHGLHGLAGLILSGVVLTRGLLPLLVLDIDVQRPAEART